jgi:Tfp pilus assembly protein PilN
MALREINLVPPDRAAKRLLARHLCFWAACMALFTGLVSVIYVAQTSMLRVQRRSLAQTKEIEQVLVARIQVQKRLQADQDRLNQEKSSLIAIRAGSRSAAQIIAKLSDHMNSETWLSQLSLEATGEPRGEARLLLTGLATSNEHLGDFLSRLSADRSFKGVTLKFANESEDEQHGQKAVKGRVRFQIGCQSGRG